MPVLLAGRKPHNIAGADLLDRSAFSLSPSATRRDDERLSERVRVPRRPRTRLERYAGALYKGRIGRLEERINPNRAGEPF